jgi:DNA-binding NtrC family response regulator
MADKRVLVVDDEIHIVHVVAIKLRNNGYEVMSMRLCRPTTVPRLLSWLSVRSRT